MMKLCMLALFAALHTADADAGDCTLADFTEGERANAAGDQPSLSTDCTACLTEGGVTEQSTDEEHATVYFACLPAAATGRCTHSDIDLLNDDDDNTMPEADCMACVSTAAGGGDFEAADVLACAPAASPGDCTEADMQAFNTDGGDMSSPCIFCLMQAGFSETSTPEETQAALNGCSAPKSSGALSLVANMMLVATSSIVIQL